MKVLAPVANEKEKKLLVQCNKKYALDLCFCDTPRSRVDKIFYYFPFERKWTAIYEKRSHLARLYISACAAMFPIGAAIICITRNAPNWAAAICAAAALAGIFYLVSAIKGWDNKCNFNTNNMAAVVSLNAAQQLTDDTAFVFLDCNFKKYEGEKLFIGQYKEKLKNKRAVVLDCVSSGETLYVAGESQIDRDKMIKALKNINSESYERPVEGIGKAFGSCIKLSAGRKVKNDVVVDHSGTRNDIDYDPELIENIGRALTGYFR